MVRRSIVIVPEKEVRAGPLRRRVWVELHGFLTIAPVFQCSFSSSLSHIFYSLAFPS